MDPLTKVGWWIDLGLTGGNGWRVIRDPSTFEGMVTFASTLPAPDACNPSGNSRVYSLDAGTGRSELVDRTSGTVLRIPFSTALAGEVISTQSVSVAGKRVIVAGSNTDQPRRVDAENPNPPGLRRLNWRELMLAD